MLRQHESTAIEQDKVPDGHKDRKGAPDYYLQTRNPMETLIKLLDYGQSYWLDNLSREKIISGELKRRVSEEGLRGITSNPSIFNEAISKGNQYDSAIRKLVLQQKNLEEIYDALTIKDVQDACDILEPVFKDSKGCDGFVSLEVSPLLARDTDGTIFEARRLHNAVGRDNCMIKIPGTQEGLAAIEQMLYEGININVTLLFSIGRYTEVANAYLRALKRRIKEGKDISKVVSVASFFLSRIDTLADQLLGQYVTLSAKNKKYLYPERLFGKIGKASAIIAYQRFRGLFESEEWQKLKSNGANVQRVLWASTSNKDPLYDDLRYVEPLIGPNTINTLPDKTITAFAKHGTLKKSTIREGLLDAEHAFECLNKIGINIDDITRQLENEGIQKFTEAYRELMSNLAAKRNEMLKGKGFDQKINAASLGSELKLLYTSLDEKQAGKRLFAKTPDLWKTDKENTQTILDGLGWLTLPDDMLSKASDFTAFSKRIKEEGYTAVVLLGMGGSSLCSEVARKTFGSSKGYPKLYVLDNTEPASILVLEKKLDMAKTLFIVASKSGSTLETNCFFKYFFEKVEKKIGNKAGRNFIAITDAGTSLIKLAERFKFRKVFINNPCVGGRYSVLSDFGILPMALVGIDIKALLNSAKEAMLYCGPDVPAGNNPGISLGALLGLAQHKGRDKVTFVLSASLKPFGYWVEQLLAESTGKEDKGLIPVNGEKLDGPSSYGNDRVFVHMYLSSDTNGPDEKKLKLLEKAGHPVISIGIKKTIELGSIYYLWEIATATAGMVIGINPFDQPNVAESKKNTENILDEWSAEDAFHKIVPMFKQDGIKIFEGTKTHELIHGSQNSLRAVMSSFLKLSQENDYVALLPYFEITSYRNNLLQTWREQIKKKLKHATTLLNGPRYLHSTGQLHKGGPDSGLYILLTADEGEEISIPGQKYGFATLHQAQALGDFKSLDTKGRRVIRIHLGENIDAGLTTVCNSVSPSK